MVSCHANANSGPLKLFGEWLPAYLSLHLCMRLTGPRPRHLATCTGVAKRSPDNFADKELVRFDSRTSRDEPHIDEMLSASCV